MQLNYYSSKWSISRGRVNCNRFESLNSSSFRMSPSSTINRRGRNRNSSISELSWVPEGNINI